jgi:hypothetical protein
MGGWVMGGIETAFQNDRASAYLLPSTRILLALLLETQPSLEPKA